MRANRDEYGNIDPYGLLQGGYSRMYKHREMVVEGVAYSDLQDAYEAQYDAVFSAMERRLAQARQNMIDAKEKEKLLDKEDKKRKQEKESTDVI